MKPIRILIVEDEALEAYSLSKCLNLEGYQVCELASCGGDALRITEHDQPDMIVMDVGLTGGLDGIETAHQIRQFSNVPILFLTGFVSESLSVQMHQLQPSQYLVKPARINEVLSKIHELLV